MLASFSKLGIALTMILVLSACSTTSKSDSELATIENPFGNYGQPGAYSDNQNITLRTKRGDRAVEVTLPQDSNSEFSVPMNPQFTSVADAEESRNGVDYQYLKKKPTSADREIASTFSKGDDPVADAKKREIEASLGLQASDEPPKMDESYLAKVDVVKQLFHSGRLEASLIEIDHLIKDYPTSGKLYEMRGTVLDRLGYGDLAVKSWKQALEFQPGKLSLKKMIDKREQQRSVASEKR